MLGGTLLLLSFQVLAKTGVLTGRVFIQNQKGKNTKSTCSQAVVFLNPLFDVPKQSLTRKRKKHRITTRNRTFLQSVTPIQQGDVVSFPNQDPIFHNVFSLSKANPFDLGLYDKGPGKSVKFDKPGLVKIYCNIHPGMVTNVLVMDNAFYTKVDKNCSYKIENLPIGRYEANVWYRMGEGLTKPLSIKSTSINVQDFDLVKTKLQIPKHKNKFGKSYKPEY